MREKKCKICGKVNPLWSDEFCNIGCAYKSLEILAKLGRLALQTQPCYWEYQYNDGDCHMEKCSSFELCRVRSEMLKGNNND